MLAPHSLEVRRQGVEYGSLDDDFAGLDLVVEGDGVAAAFEADGGEVDGDIAFLADDLAILLVITRVAAVLAGVKTDAVRAAVLLDDDGRIYCYNGGLWGGQLEMWQSGSFNPDERRPEGNEKSLGPLFAEFKQDMTGFVEPPKMIEILDENGEPIKAGDEDRRYFEGPWVHKFNGKYYLSYSTGTTHFLCYAESDNPAGPFTYKGRLMEPVIGWTTHHSIVEIDGEWYLFYHDAQLSDGCSHKRSVKFTKLTIHEDGTIDKIIPYDHEN